MSSLLMCECVLDGQLRHADPSVLFRYVPAAHSPHHPDPFTCPCHETRRALRLRRQVRSGRVLPSRASKRSRRPFRT
eukprot:993008-Rhodomonas_salina.1